MTTRVGMVVTDLDGTLLDAEHALSPRDRATLVELGERGVLRVIATGRSLFSAQRVLPRDLPIDYLVHTSGAGVLHWADQRPLAVQHMAAELASSLTHALVAGQHDFMLHRAIPDNHCFYGHRSGRNNPDFERRWQLYAAFAEELRWPRALAELMCQLVVIEPPGPSRHPQLQAAFPDCQVIRTTSPLDGRSTWVEIFPAGVGKAHAAAKLREDHAVGAALSVAIGNDYNDSELLAWADLPFVVANAPADLRAQYPNVASHNESGFSQAVRRALG